MSQTLADQLRRAGTPAPLSDGEALIQVEASWLWKAADEIERLRAALERTERNLRLAVQGKPVRDMAETLAEVKAVLERANG